jgi:hypothetical protein
LDAKNTNAAINEGFHARLSRGIQALAKKIECLACMAQLSGIKG